MGPELVKGWSEGKAFEMDVSVSLAGMEEAVDVLKGLNPVKFNYKADKEERYAGFIAEDVPELVAMNDRKGLSPMDIVAVLARVAQEQQKAISELSEEVKELKKEFKLKGSMAMADLLK